MKESEDRGCACGNDRDYRSGEPSPIGKRYIALRANFIAQHGRDAYSRAVDDSLWNEAGLKVGSEIVEVQNQTP